MQNFLVTLALPPTGFVILIGIGLLLQSPWSGSVGDPSGSSQGRTWSRIGSRLAWIALTALILFGMPVFSDSLLVGLEGGLPAVPPAGHPPQAIIILGAEVIRARDEELGIRPGLLTLDRLRTGAALYRQTGLPILVTGGTTRLHKAAVGLVMAQSLKDDFQAPARWVEAKSADTWENARFSADILRADGITSVYIVTHAWHMRRAILAFRETGLSVTAAPTALDDPVSPNLGDFVPRAVGWQTSYYAMHEWIGYAWYKLR